MYLKFLKDAYFNGKVYKEGGVYFVTNAQRFIDSGEAEVVEDYGKYHDENLKDKVIKAPKPESKKEVE